MPKSYVFFVLSCITVNAGDVLLQDEEEKISYALGYNIGQNLKRDFEVDLDMFFKGVKDSHEGKRTLSEEEMKQTMMTFQNKIKGKQTERKNTDANNKVAGEEFLRENKEKEGVVTLESGLQYKVITQGRGSKPAASDVISCHYKGSTIDGKEFDSSYKRGEPASFKLNGVIKGWTEALQLMPVGSKWMLYIPPTLAYGDRGAGRTITPGSTLIFEIELLEIIDHDIPPSEDNYQLGSKGGNLHKSTVKEWRTASNSNKRATASDWVLASKKIKGKVVQSGDVNTVKKYADELVKCINSTVLDSGFDTMKAASIGAKCMIIMGW